jgi:hypothetical protein
MTNEQHPIIPPTKLVELWRADASNSRPKSPSLKEQALAVQAAFWKDIQHIENVDEFNLAAALRAVVLECEYTDDYGSSYIDPQEILTIADELEAL